MKRFDYSLDVYAAYPNNGTAFEVWHGRVMKLLEEKGIKNTLEQSELHKLYHENLNAREVYYFIRSQTAKTCIVHVLWSDDYGQEQCNFTNSHAIREFLTRCDQIRRLLKNGK